MKLMIVVASLVPAVAEAGHHCHEVSDVVGYQVCSRFGSWSQGMIVWVEGGPVELRFTPEPLDAQVQSPAGGPPVHWTSVPGDHRSIVATGGRFGTLLGFFRGYVGLEVDAATFSNGPQLVVDASERGGGVTMDSSSGSLLQAKAVVGYRQLVGPVALGLEGAGGFRAATFDAKTTSLQSPTQMWGLAEVHARADWWVSPHWTVGAQVSTDVARMHDDSVALMLGAHLTPWDGLR
jgi:hypothetical protein